MPSDFLKQAIEAAQHQRKRRRLILSITGAGVLALCAAGSLPWVRVYSTADNGQAKDSRITHVEASKTAAKPKDDPESISNQNAENPAISQREVNQNLPTPSPLPSPRSFDRVAFMADAHTILESYGDIVGKVTFGPSMPDTVKAERIYEAQHLDRRAFRQIHDLRGHLFHTEGDIAIYQEVEDRIQHGIIRISNGLVFMGYWADDQSKMSNLHIGTSAVGEGAQALLEAGEKLRGL